MLNYEVLDRSWSHQMGFSLLGIQRQQAGGWKIEVSVHGVDGNVSSIELPAS